jgi:hypothetical protein
VLDLVRPIAAGGQFVGFSWEARRDEAGWEGTLSMCTTTVLAKNRAICDSDHSEGKT